MSARGIQPYSTAQLECMLSDIESDLVERKESFKGDAPNTVREAVCAFAPLRTICRTTIARAWCSSEFEITARRPTSASATICFAS